MMMHMMDTLKLCQLSQRQHSLLDTKVLGRYRRLTYSVFIDRDHTILIPQIVVLQGPSISRTVLELEGSYAGRKGITGGP